MIKLMNGVITRAAVYFYYTAKPRSISPIAWSRSLWDVWGKRQLGSGAPDLLRLIEQMTARSSSTGCGYGDYWSLYKNMIQRKPLRVVECGAGISPVVIAYAMRKNGGKGSFVSLEQARVYYDNIVDIFPAELRAYVDLVLSEPVEVQIGNVLGVRYQYQSPEPIDFMYIDGPSLRTQFGKKKPTQKAINADVFFVPKGERFAAILDQRIATMWALKARLSGHDIRYNVVKRQTFIEKKPSVA